MSDWRLAKSLETLRGQINSRWPDRDKTNDGTIGDTAHADRKSDHNPNEHGVVCAMDITNDTSGGPDSSDLAETLRRHKDPRIQYIISDRRIANADVQNWAWRTYNGSNPHLAHVHISVRQDPAKYDDPRPFDLDGAVIIPIPVPIPPPDKYPVLQKGDEGPHVIRLQNLLPKVIDGIFGPTTEALVKSFQKSNGLEVDGVVGEATWAALLNQAPIVTLPPAGNIPPPKTDRQTNILCTTFGGGSERQQSAYGGWIDGNAPGASLPFGFQKPLPRVRVYRDGKSIVAPLVDKGPWNTDDPYWAYGRRPQAESGTDHRGRTTNLAGIDLTPFSAAAIGLPGSGENRKGRVDWEFDTAQGGPVVEPAITPIPTLAPNGAGTPIPIPTALPTPTASKIDPDTLKALRDALAPILKGAVQEALQKPEVKQGALKLVMGLVSTYLPQASFLTLGLNWLLTSSNILGMPAGSSATTTGTAVTAGALSALAIGIWNRIDARLHPPPVEAVKQ